MSARNWTARRDAIYAAGLRAGTFDPDTVVDRIRAIDWEGALRGAPGAPRPTATEKAERAGLVWVLEAHGWELAQDDESGKLRAVPS